MKCESFSFLLGTKKLNHQGDKILLRHTIAAAALGTAFLALGPANAAEVFYQGFETDTSGWLDENNGWSGQITRDNAMTAFEGDYYGIFEQTDDTGPFTRFDGYRDTFPGTYFAEVAVYLDPGMWSAGEGFDYAVSSSGSDGGHQRDFVFHVTQDTSSSKLLVGGSNNTNFEPREDLETLNNHEVMSAGWYILQHKFRDDGGVLAVDLNLLDSTGSTLFTETRSAAADTIPGEVGGNRYGWFTNIDVAGGIKVDATSLNVPVAPVPLPATALLLSGALAGLGALRRKA